MTAPTRAVAGSLLPIAGTWAIDPGHSEVAFIGRHFMLTKVRGRFTAVGGAVAIAEELGASSVEVIIEMGSVDSGNKTRDDHLRSGDFFDVDAYPTAIYRSTVVSWAGTTGTVAGDLTIRGITRPVTLSVDYLGAVTDPWGAERAVFSAHATINREEWGLTWNMTLEAGGIVVSKEIPYRDRHRDHSRKTLKTEKAGPLAQPPPPSASSTGASVPPTPGSVRRFTEQQQDPQNQRRHHDHAHQPGRARSRYRDRCCHRR